MSTSKEAESLSLPRDRLCQHFSIEEIRSATKNFDEALVVGRGGFGKVYKGPIKNGANTVAAFKRLHSGSNQGETEFWAEIEMLSELRHCHLVSLIGYCNEGQEMILVYEYMAHGTVEDHLHKAGGTRLTWLQRLKICIGAARGLDYLHTGTGTHHGVIHRDVKSSNILLDESWSAKISDFGLSKIGPTNQTRTYVSTGVKGTFGYMDPIYFSTARLTRKSDVYSFGVVLFEVLCGRPVVDISLHEEQWGLAGWVQECIKKGKLGQIVDSSLSGQIMPSCLKEYARIAARCLHSNPNQRPTMAEIVAKLEFALSLQERMNSSATKWAFRGKVWSIFSAKSHLKSYIVSAHSTASRGEPSDKAGEKSVDPPVSTVGSGVEQTHKDKRYFFHFYDDALSFTIEDLLRASAEIISRGTYWNAYMAVLGDDINVLVKRKNNGWVQEELYKNNGWVQEEFYTEVAVLGSIRHTNILALKACYSSKDELLCATTSAWIVL